VCCVRVAKRLPAAQFCVFRHSSPGARDKKGPQQINLPRSLKVDVESQGGMRMFAHVP